MVEALITNFAVGQAASESAEATEQLAFFERALSTGASAKRRQRSGTGMFRSVLGYTFFSAATINAVRAAANSPKKSNP